MAVDDFFDPVEMQRGQEADGRIRGTIGLEILGYLLPHVSSLRERDGGFIRDLLQRRAILTSTEEAFTLSEKQFKWLLSLAYRNGFRANDETFWDKYREQALSRG